MIGIGIHGKDLSQNLVVGMTAWIIEWAAHKVWLTDCLHMSPNGKRAITREVVADLPVA